MLHAAALVLSVALLLCLAAMYDHWRTREAILDRLRHAEDLAQYWRCSWHDLNEHSGGVTGDYPSEFALQPRLYAVKGPQ
jgi:hypothetical protein